MNLILAFTFITLLATPTPPNLTPSPKNNATIQLRQATGAPLAGVTVKAMEGPLVAGTCVTDSAGRCTLSYTLLGFPVMGGKELGFTDPSLLVEGYTFQSDFGPDGGTAFYVFPRKSGWMVGLVANVPGTKGLVNDAAPDSPKPLPIWSGMNPVQATQAMATLTAFAPTTIAKATQLKAETLTASAPTSQATPTATATVQPTQNFVSTSSRLSATNPTFVSTPAPTATIASSSSATNSFDPLGIIFLFIFMFIFFGLIAWSVIAARRKK